VRPLSLRAVDRLRGRRERALGGSRHMRCAGIAIHADAKQKRPVRDCWEGMHTGLGLTVPRGRGQTVQTAAPVSARMGRFGREGQQVHDNAWKLALSLQINKHNLLWNIPTMPRDAGET
jgi:hypothetical protein